MLLARSTIDSSGKRAPRPSSFWHPASSCSQPRSRVATVGSRAAGAGLKFDLMGSVQMSLVSFGFSATSVEVGKWGTPGCGQNFQPRQTLPLVSAAALAAPRIPRHPSQNNCQSVARDARKIRAHSARVPNTGFMRKRGTASHLRLVSNCLSFKFQKFKVQRSSIHF